MQGELFGNVTGPNPTLPPLEPQINTLDFSTCQPIKKLTTHDIYSFQQQGHSLIAKLFTHAHRQNYKQEVDYLSRMNNMHIVKIIHHRNAIDPSSALPFDKSHIIVMKNAVRGDLNDYLPLYGRMNQKMVRTYFKQTVQALEYAYKLKPSILHPHLMATNLLLNAEGNIQICGWSQLTTKNDTSVLQDNIFACGQILLCMTTSFMPFYKKDSPTDTFFKFISNENIHKFWNNLQKRMTKPNLKFKLSEQFKKLVEDIFFKKIVTFAAILQSAWLNQGQIYTSSQLNELLTLNEKHKNQKIEYNKKQKLSRENMRKEILHEYHLGNNSNRSKIQNRQFISDYEQNLIREDELPATDHQFSLKIEGITPNFMIASLKQFLRQENGKVSVILCEQFILSHHKVVKKNNYALIQLDFELCMLQEEDQPLQPDIVSLKIKLSFTKSNGSIFADLTVVESNFNTYYTNLALRFIESTIQRRRVHEKIEVN